MFEGRVVGRKMQDAGLTGAGLVARFGAQPDLCLLITKLFIPGWWQDNALMLNLAAKGINK